MPRLWTPEQRNFRVTVAEELSERYEEEGDRFLENIIVGDESLVYYFTPNTLHRKSSAGLQGEVRVGEKFRPSIEQVPVYFMIFYDVKGLLLAEPVPEDITNSEAYSNIIKQNLAEAFAKKRKGKSFSNCHLLHDNTASHTSGKTQETLKQLRIESLPQAPASPDFEPHEYWLIPHMRNLIVSAKHTDKYELISSVNHHLKHLAERDFERSIKSLPMRWESCRDNKGLYVL